MAKVTDAKGRVLETKELDPGDLLDIIEAAGDASGNEKWVRLAMVICSVVSIDGVPVPLAVRKADIKSLAKKIGNDGIIALNSEMFGNDATEEKTVSGEIEQAKN